MKIWFRQANNIARRTKLSVFAQVVMLTALPVQLMADGTEVLNPSSLPISNGSGIVSGGVGLEVSQPGVISVDIPADSVVMQTILYWVGRNLPFDASQDPAPATDVIEVNGISVEGNLIGGGEDTTAGIVYRADITGSFEPIENILTLEVSGLDFARNNGAAVVVVYSDGSTALVDIRDGRDFAFLPIESRKGTEPVTHAFTPSTEEAIGELTLFVADIGINESGVRNTFVIVTVDGVSTVYDVLESAQGDAIDVVTIPVTIPAGVGAVTSQLFSGVYGGEGEGGPIVLNDNSSSLIWFASALTIADGPCVPCEGKVTSLLLEYTGDLDAVDSIQAVVKYGRKRVWLNLDLGELPFVTISGEDPVLQAFDLKPGHVGTLGSKVKIIVNNTYVSYFHTSCYKPIGPGSESGPFVVVSGSSQAGPLCEPEEPKCKKYVKCKDGYSKCKKGWGYGKNCRNWSSGQNCWDWRGKKSFKNWGFNYGGRWNSYKNFGGYWW